MKRCSKCKKLLEKSEFYKDSTRKDGFRHTCKWCDQKYMKNYYKDSNPKKLWCMETIYNHRQRGFDIQITTNELFEVANPIDNCLLCGTKLNWSRGKKHPSDNSPTLDRIDNGKVISKNAVWIVCHKCNSTKRNRSLNEFIEYCKLIYFKFNK